MLSKTSSGDTLIWSFELIDFMNEDYVMHAKSTINYPDRQKTSIVLFIIFVILSFGKWKRKQRTR